MHAGRFDNVSARVKNPAHGSDTGSAFGHKGNMAEITGEATITDVARAAGVSVSTVSRILNDKPDVAASTRARVEAVIRELGFTPHAQARRLAAGRSRTIALLFPIDHIDFTHFELDFIVGSAHAAGEAGYNFNLVTSPITRASLPALFRGAQVDGVIVMRIHEQDWRIDQLKKNGWPFVMIGRRADNTGLSLLDLDFEEAVDAAVRYLVSLGHRRIGLLNYSGEDMAQGYGPATRSKRGYERACRDLGLAPAYGEAVGSAQRLQAATERLLDAAPDVTALISARGTACIGVFRALEDRGLHVPRDISVMAITTSRTAEMFTPPLTTIDFPAYQFGYQAARMLIGILEGKRSAEQILPRPQLIVRKSTGRAHDANPGQQEEQAHIERYIHPRSQTQAVITS